MADARIADEANNNVQVVLSGKAPALEDDTLPILQFDAMKKNEPTFFNYPVKAERGRDATPALTVKRPVAYILPAGMDEVVSRLFYAGVEVSRLAKNELIEVEAYTVTSTGASTMSGLSRKISGTSERTTTVVFPKDSFVIYMNQVGASLIALALEPQAERNYGNYWLSRTNNPAHQKTFIPAVVGEEFKAYRYVKNTALETYSASMNLPVMLTSVEKVLPLTQEDINDIKSALKLGKAPEYVSKFVLPSGITSTSFVLPNGDVVEIKAETLGNTSTVKLVAPEDLSKTVYVQNSSGEYKKVNDPAGSSGGCNAGFSYILLLMVPAVMYARRRF